MSVLKKDSIAYEWIEGNSIACVHTFFNFLIEVYLSFSYTPLKIEISIRGFAMSIFSFSFGVRTHCIRKKHSFYKPWVKVDDIKVDLIISVRRKAKGRRKGKKREEHEMD